MRVSSGIANGEIDKRDELLEATYDEVLKATQHQDDKINRLLTAIAFLTAASLALANLNSAGYIAKPFHVATHDVPLALVTLGVFLVGVVAAVVMLVGSMTTPLRFPGGARPDAPPIRYASDLPAGQVYFYEIASGSLAEWHGKWQKKHKDLRIERRDSLIRETHNLAVRAEFKYARTNEAVAVLLFALFSFALSAVLVLAAAYADSDPVVMSDPLRWCIAAVLFGYCWLQLRTAVRAETQSVADLAPYRQRDDVGWRARRVRQHGWLRTAVYPATAAAVPAALVVIGERSAGGALIVCLLAAAAFVFLCVVLPWAHVKVDDVALSRATTDSGGTADMPPASTFDKRRSQTNRRLKWVVAWSGAAAVAYGVVSVVAVPKGLYEVQLIAAYAAGLVILIAGLATTATRQRRRADAYADRRGSAHDALSMGVVPRHSRATGCGQVGYRASFLRRIPVTLGPRRLENPDLRWSGVSRTLSMARMAPGPPWCPSPIEPTGSDASQGSRSESSAPWSGAREHADPAAVSAPLQALSAGWERPARGALSCRRCGDRRVRWWPGPACLRLRPRGLLRQFKTDQRRAGAIDDQHALRRLPVRLGRPVQRDALHLFRDVGVPAFLVETHDDGRPHDRVGPCKAPDIVVDEEGGTPVDGQPLRLAVLVAQDSGAHPAEEDPARLDVAQRLPAAEVRVLDGRD